MDKTDEQRWDECLQRCTDKRYMHTKNTQDVILSDRGTELAHKTTIMKRGKVVSTLYTFKKEGV